MAAGSKEHQIAAFPLVSQADSEVQSLIVVIRRLASARSLPEVMEIVTHAARAILGADGVTFVLREGDLCHYAEEDAIAPLWRGRRFPMSACISGWCIEHGRSVVIPDICQDVRIPQDAYRPTFVKSLAMAPVRQEEPIAALGVYWGRPHEASQAELELLQTVANAAALAISYVQLHEQRSAGSLGGRLFSVWKSASDHAVSAFGTAAAEPHTAAEVARQLSIGLLLAILAWAIRIPVEPFLEHQTPYATFFVAVVLGAIWGGRIAGFTALVAGGLIANAAVIEPVGRFHLAGSQLWALLTFVIVGGALLILADRLIDVSRRERELNRKLKLVRGELQHRIKNFISIAQALSAQTGRTSADIEEFDSKFSKRLHALAGAQSLIDDPTHSSAGLALLIERTLAPFRIDDRVELVSAPDLRVNEDVALGLALVLNELATNALKYGALSCPAGKVRLSCDKDGDRVSLLWREEDGPRVDTPERNGFGTRLITSALPRTAGSVQIDYPPEGVVCRIQFACTAQVSRNPPQSD